LSGRGFLLYRAPLNRGHELGAIQFKRESILGFAPIGIRGLTIGKEIAKDIYQYRAQFHLTQ
jgi:hypothetical protein